MYRNGWKGPARFKEKFIDKVSEPPCWIWIGQRWNDRYGYTRQNGKQEGAHRYMYRLYKGEFDPLLDVCHSCDNPSCVNPDHLFLGTHSDNMKDMYKKGRRNQKGENNGNYKNGLHIK